MDLSQLDAQKIVDDCPGLSLGDHLKIGGQKRVWRCAYDGSAYVLKAMLSSDRALHRLEREIQIMRECRSPYLPSLGPLPLRQLRLSSGDVVLYFLEEYVDGLPLASIHTPMPPLQVFWLCKCVGEALRVLESHGYVHRDVKPMNIMQKTASTYVLIDAGLALDTDGEQLSSTGAAPVGTAPFFSPEQTVMPSSALDTRSDLFSLGVTLYACATGEHPFINSEMPRGDIFRNIREVEAHDPKRFVPDLPQDLCAVIMTLMQKDRERRFRNAGELLASLPVLDDGAV